VLFLGILGMIGLGATLVSQFSSVLYSVLKTQTQPSLQGLSRP
jgi:hypothetical protein